MYAATINSPVWSEVYDFKRLLKACFFRLSTPINTEISEIRKIDGAGVLKTLGCMTRYVILTTAIITITINKVFNGINCLNKKAWL